MTKSLGTTMILAWGFLVSYQGFSQSAEISLPTSQTASTRPVYRPIAYTEYTPHTELFAEYRSLIVGKPGRFTAHLTMTGETFKPYTEAEVSLKLVIAGKTVYQQTLQQPAGPGLYRFPVKSDVAGTGQVMIGLKMPGYSEQFIVDNVVVYPDEATALAGQPGKEERTDVIAYAKEKAWLETFATAPVTVKRKKISVPQTAVLSTQGASYVYVQIDPEHFRKQVVKTGAQKENLLEIKRGLKADDRIITLGAEKLN